MRFAVGLFLGLSLSAAVALPSVNQVEKALNLTPGAVFTVHVDGQELNIKFEGVEKRADHKYAVNLDVR